MNIIPTQKALDDLEYIRGHLQERSPQGRRSVMSDIDAVFELLESGLIRGRNTPRDDVFEMVSVKYGYVIPYTVRGQDVFVLRVYDSRQRGID